MPTSSLPLSFSFALRFQSLRAERMLFPKGRRERLSQRPSQPPRQFGLGFSFRDKNRSNATFVPLVLLAINRCTEHTFRAMIAPLRPQVLWFHVSWLSTFYNILLVIINLSHIHTHAHTISFHALSVWFTSVWALACFIFLVFLLCFDLFVMDYCTSPQTWGNW